MSDIATDATGLTSGITEMLENLLASAKAGRLKGTSAVVFVGDEDGHLLAFGRAAINAGCAMQLAQEGSAHLTVAGEQLKVTRSDPKKDSTDV